MAIIRVMPTKPQQAGTFKLSDLQQASSPTVDVLSVAPNSTAMDELYLKFSGADEYTKQFNAAIADYTKEFIQQQSDLRASAIVSEADSLKRSGESVANLGTGAAAIMQENIANTVEQQYESAYNNAIAQYDSKVAAIETQFKSQMENLFGKVDADGRFANAVEFATKSTIASNALMNMLAEKHSALFGKTISGDNLQYLEQEGYIINEFGGYSITEAGYDYIDSIINAQDFDFGDDSNFNNLVDQIIEDEYGTEFSALDEDKQANIKNQWKQWLYDFSDHWRYSGLGLMNEDGTVDNFWTSTESDTTLDIDVGTSMSYESNLKGHYIDFDISNVSFAKNTGSKKWTTGDDIQLNVNGHTTSVEIASEHKELLNASTVKDLSDGSVFTRNNELYVKTNGSVYKLEYNFWTDGDLADVLRRRKKI